MRNRIDTTPIHSTYSSTPSYILEPIENNGGLQFVYKQGNSTIFIYVVLVATILFVSLLDDVSPWAIAVIIAIGMGIYAISSYFKNQMFIFSTQENKFYKFNKKSQERSEEIAFSTIEAIQLLYYIEESSNSNDEDDVDRYSYIDAYELNLVLKNRRVNIVAHSDYKSMKKDADRLAHLLNVSVEEV